MNQIPRKSYILIVVILTTYGLLLLSFTDIFSNVHHVSILSILILFLYIVFVVFLSRIPFDSQPTESTPKIKCLKLKFTAVIIAIIVLSILLTMQADVIAAMNPTFSSSTVGAYLLGITTSLPEVVSSYTLAAMGSYGLCFANIIGSNAFNFIIISICDLFISGKTVYALNDKDSFIFILFGIIMHIIMLTSVLRKERTCKVTYVIPSILIIIAYMYLFYLQLL